MNTKSRTGTALAASIGICLTLMAGPVAANGKSKCQRISAKGHAPIFQLPCEEDPSFFACQLGTTRGKFTAEWKTFFTQAPVDIGGFALHIPPEAASTLYQSEVDVFQSHRGSLRGYSHFIVDQNAFATPSATGGLAGTIFVTEGTGIYRQATGWIVWVSTEPTLVDFLLHGEVCGPNIPADINS